MDATKAAQTLPSFGHTSRQKSIIQESKRFLTMFLKAVNGQKKLPLRGKLRNPKRHRIPYVRDLFNSDFCKARNASGSSLRNGREYWDGNQRSFNELSGEMMAIYDNEQEERRDQAERARAASHMIL